MPRGRHVVAVLCGLALTACTQGGLDPRGTEAKRLFDETVVLTILATAVCLLVIGLWWWGIRRPGTADLHDAGEGLGAETPFERRFLIGGGIVMPAVVMAGTFGMALWATVAAPSDDGELVIEVDGHRYWWEVTYAEGPGVDQPFETANQIHIPVDTEVTVVLRSDDVIHSFWVPNLAGKLDLTPGRENRFTFTATDTGTYPGYCAEYCGLQHAWMKFDVVVMEQDAFGDWARGMAEPAAEPTDELARRGREVYLENSCVGCHVIRGSGDERAEVGPDLTHLASRNELGAGIIELTSDNLTAWIVNPQAIKPGNDMPPQQLSSEDLEALVAYLMGLE